jgi:transposase
MFFPESRIRVHLYGQPCDMRKSFDGLSALVRNALGRDPMDGSLYVYVNRKATQMRVLYFDRSGYCVWGKRLEAGKFLSDWGAVCTREMDWTQLKLLIEGIEIGRRRKRLDLRSSPSNIFDHNAAGVPIIR